MLDEGKVITHLITCLFTVSGTPAHQRTCLEVKEHDQLKKKNTTNKKRNWEMNEIGFNVLLQNKTQPTKPTTNATGSVLRQKVFQ